MTSRTDFIASILAAPWEYVPYLALADWLDERGEDPMTSFALRWMAAKGFRPHHRTFYAGSLGAAYRAVPRRYSWGWYCEAYTPRPILSRDGVQAHARLPRVVYLTIASAVKPYALFGSWADAVTHLAGGLDVMRKWVTL